MISSTLGAPSGGTTRGGHQVVESVAFSLITPPNGGGADGRQRPSMMTVALGLPGVPWTTPSAEAGAAAPLVCAARLRPDLARQERAAESGGDRRLPRWEEQLPSVHSRLPRWLCYVVCSTLRNPM